MANELGFIGLGVMGGPMARNLSKEHTVVGFDTQAARFEGLPRVKHAQTAAEVAQRCRVVFLSLPSAAIVESVILGPDGLIHHLSAGSLVLDLSTGLPAVSRQIAARLAEKGIDYADVPVSGGEAGAQAGTLALMAGASEAVFDRARPYLKPLGSVVRAGDIGAGNVAKLVNNMIVGVTFAVIAEGFAVAVGNGLDPALLHSAIQGGWAGSKVLDVSAPAIAAGEYKPGGTIDMIQKDLGYAALLADESEVETPMTAAARELFAAAQAAGWGAQSQPALFRLWERSSDRRES